MLPVYDGKREIRLLLVISGVALAAYGTLGVATGRDDFEMAIATLAIGTFVVGVVLWRGDVLAN